MQKTFLLTLLTMSLALTLGACTLGEDAPVVPAETEIEETELVETEPEAESTEETASGDIQESEDSELTPDSVNSVDIMGFIALDWRIDGGDGKEYITKDELLDFDKSAVFKVNASSFGRYGAQSSSFEAQSINSTFGGYACFVDYNGRIKEDSENIVAEENAMLGTWYSYIGDGSDVMFDPCMIVTVPNVTYNDFVSILNSLSEMLQLPDDELSPPESLSRLKDEYGADTVFTDFIDEQIYINSTRIVGTDWTYSIHLIDEDMLQGAQNEGLDLNPLSIPLYNRMEIYIQYPQY